MTDVWGIPEYPASKILESLLTSRPIKVEKESGQHDEFGKPIMVVDHHHAGYAAGGIINAECAAPTDDQW